MAEDSPEFTMAKLLAASWTLSTGKSPGPDRIPPEVVKEAVVADLVRVLRAMNLVLCDDCVQFFRNNLNK